MPSYDYTGVLTLQDYISYYPFDSRVLFFGVRERASGIYSCCKKPEDFTVEQFLTLFPIFTKKDDSTDPPTITPVIPEETIEMFIKMALSIVNVCWWGDLWVYGVGLVVAHFITLYLYTYYPEGLPDGMVIGDVTSMLGITKSATLGDASVSYDTTLSLGGNADYGSWNSTIFGQQYVTLAKTYTTPMYVI